MRYHRKFSRGPTALFEITSTQFYEFGKTDLQWLHINYLHIPLNFNKYHYCLNWQILFILTLISRHEKCSTKSWLYSELPYEYLDTTDWLKIPTVIFYWVLPGYLSKLHVVITEYYACFMLIYRSISKIFML